MIAMLLDFWTHLFSTEVNEKDCQSTCMQFESVQIEENGLWNQFELREEIT